MTVAAGDRMTVLMPAVVPADQNVPLPRSAVAVGEMPGEGAIGRDRHARHMPRPAFERTGDALR